MDLGGQFDIILGEDWLTKNKANMNYKDIQLEVYKRGLKYPLYPREPAKEKESESADDKAPIFLSVAQFKRCIRKGSKYFAINVTDSGIAPQTSGTETSTDGPSPAIKALQDRFQVVFTEGGVGLPPDRKLVHTIPTEPGAEPPYRPLYRLSPKEMAEVERQVKELLRRGLIEPSTSPHGAPILFVDKPDGSLRMVHDYRALNRITIPNRAAIPRIDQLMDGLAGNTVFSSLDLQ